MFSPFVAFCETMMMSVEASRVISLRMAMMLQGDASLNEMQLMVSEKVEAFSRAATDMACGISYSAVCNNFRTAIAANETRLLALSQAPNQ